MSNAPVLIVNLAAKFGGVDMRVVETARALAENGRPYAVATITDSPLHKQLIAASLNAIPFAYRKTDPRLLFALYKTIKAGGYQVVDAHNFQSQFYGLGAAVLAKVPTRVSSVHTIYRIVPGGIRGRLQELVLRLNVLWGCRFMVVSRSLADYVRSLGAKEVSVIYNGVDLDEMGISSENISIRQECNWPEDSYVLTFVGRLVWQKGLDYLLPAVQQACQRHPNFRCLIVGDGKLRSELEAQAKLLKLDDCIHFMGYRTDVTAILADSDFFCLPSRSEGLPYALLEACAYKLPLLLSDVDGMSELFRHHETAYMVPSGDVVKLTAGIDWLMANSEAARQLGENAHDFVQARLNPQQMTTDTLAIY